MQDKMTYMVVIKPDGKAHVVVLDRGRVDCGRSEEVASEMGDVLETEILPEDEVRAPDIYTKYGGEYS